MPLDEIEPAEFDVDKALAEIESPTPQSAAPQTPPEQSATNTPPAASQQYPDVEFTWNDKKVKAPWTKAQQWAQQGYDYSQKLAGFKKEQDTWKQEKQSQEEKFKPYQDVDAFALKNADWWEFVQGEYKKKLQNPNANPSQPNPELDEVRGKMGKFEEFMTGFEKFTDQLSQKAADDHLDSEIQTIRKQYPNLDWTSVDESGLSLEQRVLKHAMDNGMKKFAAAFRDYNFDNLVKLESEKAKEAVTKEAQKRTKLGLLGSSPTPTTGQLSRPVNTKNKTYNELADDALREMSAG